MLRKSNFGFISAIFLCMTGLPDLGFSADLIVKTKGFDPVARVSAGKDAEELSSALLNISKGVDVIKATKIVQRIADKNDDTNAGYAQLRLAYLDIKDNYGSAEGKLKKIIEGTRLSTPAVKAEAVYTLGHLHVRSNENKEAIKDFKSLVSGNVPCSGDMASTAAKRLAFLYQKTFQGQDALRLWEQIAVQETERNAQAHAYLQCAGLHWEIGKQLHGKRTEEQSTSDFRESQRIAKLIIDEYPNAPSKTRATASLLYLEQFFFLKQYSLVPSLVEKHLRDFPKDKIQASTALVWKIVSCYRMQDYQDTISAADTLLKSGFTEADVYPNMPAFSYANIYKTLAQSKLGGAELQTADFSSAKKSDPNRFDSVYKQILKDEGLAE